MPTALITGVTGQDGSYLAELLLAKGYTVHGLKRRSSSLNTGRIDHLYQDPHQLDARFLLHYGDLADSQSLVWMIEEIQPDEIYNLGAQSHVAVSFETPEYTANVDALGTLRLLEAMRITDSKARFYQASTSEMFGNAPPPQNELTPFLPRSPYAAAKVYAHSIAVNYREAYGMHISCGIMFNHCSPRQGETFLPRKVARAVAAIKRGKQDRLYLGNMAAKRDWGHARDYVEGMWLMLQQEFPGDYVLATGQAHSVAEYVTLAFDIGDLPKSWPCYVFRDNRYLRPTEVNFLLGDARKAREKLGWQPRTTFIELVREMVEAEL